MADEVNPQTVGLLEVSLSAPRMSGFFGPAWPRYSTIFVGIGGEPEPAGWQMLPFEFDMDLIKGWELGVRIPVTSDWAHRSLDIFVERADYNCLLLRRSRRVVVTRGGPHTSGYTAVISRARVRLLDALVLGSLDGDEDEEEQEKMKKRRSEAETGSGPRLLEGTVPFGMTVPLLDWELPAPGDEHGSPRAVVRGTVNVHLKLRPLFSV